MTTLWRQHEFIVRTSGVGFTNVTDRIHVLASETGITVGRCDIFIRHTSASLVIQENADPAVLRDLERFMNATVPRDSSWEHDDEGPDDMPAHVRSVLTATNLTVPIGGGKLLLGTWQGVFLWEHRDRPRDRRLVVTFSGLG